MLFRSDLCAVIDTLIADGDGLYHPVDFNDRLVLGLKGAMSEALWGIRHKASYDVVTAVPGSSTVIPAPVGITATSS